MTIGRSAASQRRACAPSGLSRDASQAEPLVPNAVAPLGYQAEALRGQVCDDLNRRYWRGKSRLMRFFEDRKEQIQRDFDKLPADQFLARYNGWKFL